VHAATFSCNAPEKENKQQNFLKERRGKKGKGRFAKKSRQREHNQPEAF